MRKFILALGVGLLAVALATPSFAADFKYTGFFRLRGISSDDSDRNDKRHDGVQGMDTLARPRFTATSEGGKVWAIYELDFFADGGVPNGNLLHGINGSRQEVGANRWLVDFAIPGTTLRARWGRTDWTSPDKQIYDSTGRSRNPGIGVYGKLWGPLSLSFFTSKVNESNSGNNFLTRADDRDDYYLGIAWKVGPKFTVTPWAAYSRDNREKSTGNVGFDLWYFAVNFKGKAGILSYDVTPIFETGKMAERVRTATTKPNDDDIEAWALLASASATFGKLKVTGRITLMSGDDDTVPGTSASCNFPSTCTPTGGNQAGQKDKKLKRFVLPQNNGKGWLYGGQIASSKDWTTLSARVPGAVTNVTLVGDGRHTRMNGVQMYGVYLDYKLTKTLTLKGNVNILRSAKKAADQCTDTNGNGVCDQGEPTLVSFKNNKDFGTEIDFGIRWFPYKSLRLEALGAYLWAGDYGTQRGGRAPSDTWQIMYELRHFF